MTIMTNRIEKDPSQILSTDRELLVKARKMEKYEVGTLGSWLKLISVSEEKIFLQPLQLTNKGDQYKRNINDEK